MLGGERAMAGCSWQDLGQCSALTRQLKALSNSSPKESDTLFWPSKALHAPGALTGGKALKHINPFFFFHVSHGSGRNTEQSDAWPDKGRWLVELQVRKKGSTCPSLASHRTRWEPRYIQHLPVHNAGFYGSPGSVTSWGELMWVLLPHSREVIHKSQSWTCKNTSRVSTISQGLTVGSDFRWRTCLFRWTSYGFQVLWFFTWKYKPS